MDPKIFNRVTSVGAIIGLVITGFIGYFKLLDDVYFHQYLDIWTITKNALCVLGVIALVVVGLTTYLGYIISEDNDDNTQVANILAKVVAFSLGVIGWFCLLGNIYLMFW